MTKSDNRLRLFDDSDRLVDRFGLVLVISTLSVITLSLVDMRSIESVRSKIGVIAVTVFVGATLLLALRASGVRRRYQTIADILVGVGLVISLVVLLVAIFSESTAEQAELSAPPMIWIVLTPLASLLVIRRLTKHREVTGRTLLGAVSAYLLIALAFNFAFIAVDYYAAGTFFGSEQPTTSFMYFSLTTITTLGYGDLAPAGELGRLLATVEAVVGQVYLVTFVGMVVGLLVAERQRHMEESA